MSTEKIGVCILLGLNVVMVAGLVGFLLLEITIDLWRTGNWIEKTVFTTLFAIMAIGVILIML